MPTVDMAVLAQPLRLAAARRARRLLPGMPMPLDAIAALAARLTGTPIAVVAVMDVVEEHFIGSHGLPSPLDTHEPVPVAYSVCKYIVSADHPVAVQDMSADPDLRDHALAVEFGARAFAGVPLRDSADRTVGSLVVVDTVTRPFTEQQIELLIEVATLLAGLPADGVYTDAATADGPQAGAVLDGTQEAFVAVDAAGTVIGWNPAAQTMLGWTSAEAQGRMVGDLILPEPERTNFRLALPSLIAASGPQHTQSRQVRVRHRDGHDLMTHAFVSTLLGEHGPLMCMFLADLTGQQDAEHDDDQRGLLRALLDSLAAPVAAVDPQGRLRVANRAMCQLHGLAEDATSAAFDAALAGHLRRLDGAPLPHEDTPLLRAMDGEHVRDQELLVDVPGVPVRTVLADAQPILTAGVSRWGAVMTCLDITERRRVERFRDCQVAVAAALAYHGDVDRGADQITASVATALGWPHVELWLLDGVTDTLRLAGQHSTIETLQGRFLTRPIDRGVGVTGTVWAGLAPLWVPDLSATTHLDSPAVGPWARMCVQAGLRTMLAVPIPDSGRALGVLTCFADSPEHDQTQLTTLLTGIADQLGQFIARRHGEQLTCEVARGKDDFLSLVGHEMRTPLTTISSYIQMLLDDPDPHTHADDTRRLHEGIARNSDALRAIIDDLLDLAALESGHVHIDIRPVDLVAIAEQALRTVQPAADHNGVTITADLPDSCPTTGDPQRLRQILDNLLSNAVKYSPGGGHTRLTVTRDEQVATITVADTGIGVPPEERRQLFHRFYRATNARHTAIPGTGLGLSIVRAILDAHHGTITLDDALTTGTTVTVRLPHNTGHATSPAGAHAGHDIAERQHGRRQQRPTGLQRAIADRTDAPR